MIRKRIIVIVTSILLILEVASTGNGVQTSAASKKVINNGERIVQYNGYDYYIKSKNDKYSIAKINTKKKKETILIQLSSMPENKLYIYNNRLYYSFNDGIYNVRLDGKDIKKVCDGTLWEMKGAVIFYEYETGFYKIGIDGKENKKLYSGGEGILRYIKSIGNNLYFYRETPHSSNMDEKVIMYRCNKASYKISKLATDNPRKKYGNGVSLWSGASLIENIVEKGNYIYYSVGIRQGSGLYWYGDIKQIKKDGTGKKTIVKQTEESEIAIVDNKLYFLVEYGSKWATYDLKTKKVKKLGIESYGIDIGSYCYRIEGKESEKNFDLYRFKKYTNKSGYKKIATIGKTKGHTAELAQVDRVGSWIYFSVSIKDYNKGGWRGTLVTFNQYRVKANGKQLTKLN